jgi:hypothetical protein
LPEVYFQDPALPEGPIPSVVVKVELRCGPRGFALLMHHSPSTWEIVEIKWIACPWKNLPTAVPEGKSNGTKIGSGPLDDSRRVKPAMPKSRTCDSRFAHSAKRRRGRLLLR